MNRLYRIVLGTACMAAAVVTVASPAQADYWNGYYGRPYRHAYWGPRYYAAPPVVIYEAPPPPPVVMYQQPGVAYAPAPPPPMQQAAPPYPVSAAPTGQNCREFQSTVVVDGRPQPASGTACQQPDGTWRIVR